MALAATSILAPTQWPQAARPCAPTARRTQTCWRSAAPAPVHRPGEDPTAAPPTG